jgi:hypothetical protein
MRTTEVARRLTAQEATDQGLVAPGEAWDEASQRPLPRGELALVSAMERPADLQRQLEAFERNRKVILRFVGEQLQEAEYDTKGYLVPGKLHDYYLVPGSKTKALTKRGAENVAQVARFFKGETKLVDKTATKEYCDATVEVTLLDHFRRPVGSAVSACSTAERGFTNWKTQEKYGANYRKVEGDFKQVSPPDYRAALNDLVAKAGKRAFVQAVIYAAALDEIFHVADEDRAQAKTEAGGEQDQVAPAAVLPFATKTYPKGTKLGALNVAELTALRPWCAERQKWAYFVESIDLELEDRRTSGSEDRAPV